MDLHNVTYENSQARERTQILMDLANKYNGLVVGTGDLSELALGWATYNGDHMSMYSVNGGIPKTQVRTLVNWVANNGEVDAEASAALLDVLDTPVSPELLPPDASGKIKQKTEDLVGPYELHDFFLYHILHNAYRPAKVLWLAEKAFDGVYDRETLLKWLKNLMPSQQKKVLAKNFAKCSHQCLLQVTKQAYSQKKAHCLLTQPANWKQVQKSAHRKVTQVLVWLQQTASCQKQVISLQVHLSLQ